MEEDDSDTLEEDDSDTLARLERLHMHNNTSSSMHATLSQKKTSWMLGEHLRAAEPTPAAEIGTRQVLYVPFTEYSQVLLQCSCYRGQHHHFSTSAVAFPHFHGISCPSCMRQLGGQW